MSFSNNKETWINIKCLVIESKVWANFEMIDVFIMQDANNSKCIPCIKAPVWVFKFKLNGWFAYHFKLPCRYSVYETQDLKSLLLLSDISINHCVFFTGWRFSSGWHERRSQQRVLPFPHFQSRQLRVVRKWRLKTERRKSEYKKVRKRKVRREWDVVVEKAKNIETSKSVVDAFWRDGQIGFGLFLCRHYLRRSPYDR